MVPSTSTKSKLKTNWKKLQKRHARARSQLQRLNNNHNHPRPRPRKPRYNKRRFKRAMRGTGGLFHLIAQKLGCHRHTVRNLLARPDWEDIRLLYEDECETRTDGVEDILLQLIKDSEDDSVRANLIKWFLERQRRDQYDLGKKLVLEGGKNPIKTQNQNQNANVNVGVDVSTLDLPVEIKRQLLQALDAKDGTESFIQLPQLPAPVASAIVDVTDAEEDSDEEETSETEEREEGSEALPPSTTPDSP